MPTLELEHACGYPQTAVAGVDEVGRGCLAGPVVAAAVVLPDQVDWRQDEWLGEVTDSKALSERKREILAPRIRTWAAAWAVAHATVEEIDSINILHASHLAMKRAVEQLTWPGQKTGQVLVDGHLIPKNLNMPAQAVIKGDLKCLSIACASILAKVHRDQWMVDLDREYPGYGLAIHKGYPTPSHRRALEQLGPSRIHRRSFGPVRQLALEFGRQAEGEAVAELLRAGEANSTRKILARNYRKKMGEIDVIFEERGSHGTELVFLEVRARSEGAQVGALESVTPVKQRRIEQVANVFLGTYESNGGRASSVRFDVLEWNGKNWEHVRGAWSP